RHHGEVHPQGIILKIPVTQQDIADMLSMTRETVTRQYARLKRNGLIAMDRHLVITNLPGLQAAYA
ncbi:MAG TPA: helix-turn-helix domain-containing protein, partial [Candidatus Saccharimonadales bacterium]|nr:helix-turn-helix domain-containing protein [Candidatus Saccharimonadales bacterium]